MRTNIYPREQVAAAFAINPTVLIRYEQRGLLRVARDGSVEGYAPAEVRRVWTIVSLQRDLGVNLAGVEAILKLRGQLDEIHRRLGSLAADLNDALEDEFEPGPGEG